MPRAPIHTRPCPTCGTPCQVKYTHKGKPYWHCDDCIAQVFIRGQRGIARLNASLGRRQETDDDFA